MCADRRSNSSDHEAEGGTFGGVVPNRALERLLPKTLKAALPSQVGAQTLSVYMRHGPDCPRRPKVGDEPTKKQAAKYWKGCKCPKWIYVFHDGKDYRFSAQTRSWEQAEKTRFEIADLLNPDKNELRRLKEEHQAKRVTVAYAVERYLADAESRNLAPDTLRALGLLLKTLLNWTETHDNRLLDELNVDRLEEWRNTWKIAPLTKQARQGKVRSFFRFCERRGWLHQNPASLLTSIRVDQKPTDYFPLEEFIQIINATKALAEKSARLRLAATRLRTLILLMRWSGLRISDAVTLERSRLVGNNIQAYQQKSRLPVFVPLPPAIAKSLRNVPAGQTTSPRYFFWNGRSRSVGVKYWHKLFIKLFRIADIRQHGGTPKRCRPHMFRDTFAVESLISGVRIEEVSKLLGHASIKTTEKHYLPWVIARQQRLVRVVEESWKFQVIVGTEERDSTNEGQRAMTGKTSGEKEQNAHEPADELSRPYALDRASVSSANVATPSTDVTTGANPRNRRGLRKRRSANQLGNNIKRAVHRREFPYILVGQMWHEGKTVRQIAEAIGRVDPGNDPTHTVRCFLRRMHEQGYTNGAGCRVKLPYRSCS